MNKKIFIFFFLSLMCTPQIHASESECRATCYWLGSQNAIGIPVVEKAEVSAPQNPRKTNGKIFEELFLKCEGIGHEKFKGINARPTLWVFPYPNQFIEFVWPSQSGEDVRYVLVQQYLPEFDISSICQ